jgi:predicted SAM-dependent methyltransferase
MGNDNHSLQIVNFGCGPQPSEGCINIDGSPTVLLARLPIPPRMFGARAGFIQATRDFGIRHSKASRLDFAENSLDAFYASHVLEHMPKDECDRLLSNIRKWLKPSGVLRIVLPDLRILARDYLSNKLGADDFVAQTHLVPEPRTIGLMLGYRQHKWMYDASSFMLVLQRLGFSNIEEVAFAKSRMPALEKLDLEMRKHESFYVEAGK